MKERKGHSRKCHSCLSYDEQEQMPIPIVLMFNIISINNSPPERGGDSGHAAPVIKPIPSCDVL